MLSQRRIGSASIRRRRDDGMLIYVKSSRRPPITLGTRRR
jgi:hypothetical protein